MIGTDTYLGKMVKMVELTFEESWFGIEIFKALQMVEG